MAASGGAWTPPILRGAHEPTGAVDLSVPSRAALASRAVATKPEWPRTLGSYAAPHQPLVASAYCLSSLSPAPHGRYYLRQEPDAVVPLVRICGGGREQSRSLLRLNLKIWNKPAGLVAPTGLEPAPPALYFHEREILETGVTPQ